MGVCTFSGPEIFSQIFSGRRDKGHWGDYGLWVDQSEPARVAKAVKWDKMRHRSSFGAIEKK